MPRLQKRLPSYLEVFAGFGTTEIHTEIPMHKVFISYHHRNDQGYKNELVKCGDGIFVDRSVDTGDIPR